MSRSCSIITSVDSLEFAIATSKILYGFAGKVFYITVNLNGTSEYTAAFLKINNESHVA